LEVFKRYFALLVCRRIYAFSLGNCFRKEGICELNQESESVILKTTW
jgi:hypothetical protein